MAVGRVAALRVLLQALRGGGEHGAWERLRALPRLVLSLFRGSYRSWDRRRALTVIAGIVYVASPVDFVPELFLGPLGLADDALVAAWLAGAVLAEVDEFLSWEKNRPRVVRGETQ